MGGSSRSAQRDSLERALDSGTRSAVFTELSDSTTRLLPGERLSHYEIVDLIGHGGMGEVYLAQDAALGRKVAIKALRGDLAEDAHGLARFKQEARAASALNHPNILTIHDVFEWNGRHFIVTEHIDGITLRDEIERGRLSVRRALDVGAQIASALSAAHRAGVVHRDIKPENVMCRPDGIVKVLDFGLAKLSRADDACASPGDGAAGGADSDLSTEGRLATDSGVVMGTARYMSPEQARGTPVDARTDVFSLGAVLFEMIAARPAFEGTTVADLMASVLQHEPPALRTLRPETPGMLEWTIAKTLRKDREERYQSARELLADLENLRDAPPEEAPAPIPIEPRPRRALPVAAALLIIAVLAAGAAVSWLRARALPTAGRYTRITRDGAAKGCLATDGTRLYYSAYDGSRFSSFETSAAGGESRPLALPPNWCIQEVSRDGSELLVAGDVPPSTRTARASRVPVVGGAPRHVGEIRANSAAWGPGGQTLFMGAGSKLHRVALDDGREIAPAREVPDGMIHWLRVSPDGTRVRFTVGRQLAGNSSLWEMNADGGQLRRVEGWDENICCGSWSPDGRFYYFWSGNDIWVTRGDTRGAIEAPRRLTLAPIEFRSPVPSPDGRRLFVLGGQWRGELMRFDRTSARWLPYLPGLTAEMLKFSPDGRSVVYRSYPEGTLWRSAADGSQPVQLTYAPLFAGAAEWSPDGTTIVFSGQLPHSPFAVYLIAADGGTPERLLPAAARKETSVNWSPDGRSIAFDVSLGLDRERWIELVDVASRQATKLEGPAVFAPKWSPDGRFLLAQRIGSFEGMLYDVERKTWQGLGVNLSHPLWTRDGTRIIFKGYDRTMKGSLFELTLGDRRVTPIARFDGLRLVYGSAATWMGLAPDDSPVVLRDIGSQDIYAVDLELP